MTRKIVSHSHPYDFISERRKEIAMRKPLNELTREVLVNILCRLYVTAYSHDSKYYSHNSMGAIRTDLDRYFNKDDINISMTF